jgi:hypothetical protein
MKLTMLLADAAQAIGGKLYILGGGWSTTTAPTPPSAIAIKIDVPWEEANRRHQLKCALYDEDARPVLVPTPTGDKPVEITGDFEVGRPAGTRPGSTIDLALALSIGPLALQAGRVYVWRLFVDERSDDGWQLRFSTRRGPAPGGPP